METTPPGFYTADPNVKLLNPERGMYSGSEPNFGIGSEGSPPNYHTIVYEWLWLAPVCNVDLTWNGYNQFGTSPELDKYAAKLEKAREDGYKILFRPRYDQRDPDAQEGPPPGGPSDCTFDGGSAKVFHADSKERQFNHIDAVAKMLGDYKDVIAFIQAGYLGNWGEWNTEQGSDDPDPFTKENAPLLYNRTDRSDIIDRVLSAYAAEDIAIAQDVELRRPVFAKEVVVRNASANVGLHNDCFMTSNSDSGTYSHFTDFAADGSPQNLSVSLDLDTVEDAKEWAKTWTENSSFGGETCPSDGLNERWRSCPNMTGDDTTGVTSEPASLHMNYLNQDFFEGAIDKWKKDGCYDEIRCRLGYRFEVESVEYTKDVSAGEKFSVAVDVKNTGWARLHKPRLAKLVLRNGAEPLEYPFPKDEPVSTVSNWAPGTTTISVSGLAPPGTYSVWLWIPDPDLLEFLFTSPNPEEAGVLYKKAKTNYAVKLATKRNDANVFDPDTAENDLGVEITVHSRMHSEVSVPLVTELRTSFAVQKVRAADLVPELTGDPEGPNTWVWRQSPREGRVVPRGSTVSLQLRTGPIQ